MSLVKLATADILPVIRGHPHHTHKHRLARWPGWASRWLGYRPAPPSKQPEYVVWFWSFLGAFCAIAMIQALFTHASYFVARGVPPIVASYGASAVLIYGAIDAPLAQPRALIGGHFIGGLVGVCITKLFMLLPTEQRYTELEWLAGSLSTATAIVLMQMTGTTHPPAGATALLAATNKEVRDMGWYYLPVLLLTSTLTLVVAMIFNNVQRRYPQFWLRPIVVIPAPVSADLGGPDDTTPTSSSAQSTTSLSSQEEEKQPNVSLPTRPSAALNV